MVHGRIHSIESMGLVDGPGIRTVVFMQGCNMRCMYCHNPDTWSMQEANIQSETAQSLLEKLKRYKPYYGKYGGVTFSGGEPLLQKDFLLEILPLCKNSGINTCLDTAGHGVGDYEKILKYTDLVLFDIKHYTTEGYRLITGNGPEEALRFLKAAQDLKVPLWIRHVVVPGITDSEEHIRGLCNYIKTLDNVQKTELLPYHVLGISKYDKMNIPYPLKGVKAMESEALENLRKLLNKNINNSKEEQL